MAIYQLPKRKLVAHAPTQTAKPAACRVPAKILNWNGYTSADNFEAAW